MNLLLFCNSTNEYFIGGIGQTLSYAFLAGSVGDAKSLAMWKSDLLGGQLLRNVAGSFSNEQTDIALPVTKKITALLFSALWCPPCEQFLKDLIVFYDKMTVTHSDFEIILVSSDKDKRQFSKCEF